MSVTRRNFIGMVAAAGAAVPLTGFGIDPALSEAASPKINIFSKGLEWMDYSMLAETLAEAGFSGIDLAVRPGGSVLPENVERDLPKVAAEARRRNLEIPMMVTAISNADDPVTERILKTAANVGVKHYRLAWLDYDQKKSILQNLDDHKKRLEKIALLNKKYNIQGCYQNHNGIRVGGPIWDIWQMIHDMDTRYMSCQYDIYHAMVEGMVSWPVTLRLISKYIGTLTLKDLKYVTVNGRMRPGHCAIGEGIIEFAAYVQALKNESVSAPFSLHFEYQVLTEEEKKLSPKEKQAIVIKNTKRDLDKMRGILGA